jgi:hypothetical protein
MCISCCWSAADVLSAGLFVNDQAWYAKVHGKKSCSWHWHWSLLSQGACVSIDDIAIASYMVSSTQESSHAMCSARLHRDRYIRAWSAPGRWRCTLNVNQSINQHMYTHAMAIPLGDCSRPQLRMHQLSLAEPYWPSSPSTAAYNVPSSAKHYPQTCVTRC